MKTITFITGNKNKLDEVRAILGAPDPDTGEQQIDIQSRAIEGIPEIQGTIEDIAREKCRAAAAAVNGPVLTEDTALEFNALKGLPGPYIKWFLDALGHDGLNKLVEPYEDRSAQAVCTFAFSYGPGQEVFLFQGRTEGKIVPARGPPNFGWDPIFEYEGRTYAEMDKEEKNKISHRYKALLKLKEWLNTQP
ncbi:hypothetical protein VTN31DRAFT_3703 [Thermomyces dupontii]|uniref:uncharacterized protein n=1 Tax=Talaromyces thermophilus TaxID=28565 RepID=UPI003742C64B